MHRQDAAHASPYLTLIGAGLLIFRKQVADLLYPRLLRGPARTICIHGHGLREKLCSFQPAFD